MLIGLFPIAAKPYHLGHHLVIKKASNECDRLILIVSLLDRDNIKGNDMARIWQDYIIPKLPSNIDPVFLNSSPIVRLYEILQMGETSDFSFKIYSDDMDIKKYDDLSKSCPNLVINNRIEKVGISRSSIANISGTKMREFLMNNDFDSFSKFMPEEFDNQSIFNILTGNK